MKFLRRSVRLAWRVLSHRVVPAMGYAASYLRSPCQIVRVWPETGIVPGPRVAIFVHYDRAGSVRADVLHYLAALRSSGASVVFVTNSVHLRPDAMAALKPLCDGIIIRRNVGYDFGAMRDGLAHLGLPRPETELVLLVNDSVYGPLRPLDVIWQGLDFAMADLWGLTDSWQTRYHLQSYFLAAGRTALTHESWRRFWRGVRPVASKWWVIRHYEVGLTQRLLRGGLRAKAIWPYTELVRQVSRPGASSRLNDVDAGERPDPVVAERANHANRIRTALAAQRPLNPTADLWRQLLEAGFPFIKRELLRSNPSAVSDIADWREVVLRETAAGLDLIDSNLKLVVRGRAP